MDIDELIGKVIKDENRKEYHITGIFHRDKQWAILKTQEGPLIKINISSNKELYTARYRWLIKKGEQLPKETRIAFPMAVLEEPYIGYVTKKIERPEKLSVYLDRPKNAEFFMNWYFKVTGGLERRLFFGLILAKSLRYLHINNCAYVDLSPESILMLYTKGTKNLAFINPDNITSGTYMPLSNGVDFYMAPELAGGEGIVNTITDTYAYAILLFKILTSCHPFLGDDVETEALEELAETVNNGELPFIGDPASDTNKNSIYEKIEVFMPEELKNLFLRMFTEGKLCPEKRPALCEFISVLGKARYAVIRCTQPGCNVEYIYEKSRVCPVCKKKAESLYKLSSKQIIEGNKDMVLPLKDAAKRKNIHVNENRAENVAYITTDKKVIYASFFDDGIVMEDDKKIFVVELKNTRNLAIVNYSSSAFAIRYRYSKKRQLLPPYIEGKPEPLLLEEDSHVFFDTNMDLTMKTGKVDLSQAENFYGKTTVTRVMQIMKVTEEESCNEL